MAALFRASAASTFDELYRGHVASVYRYAFAVVGNRADAEDITQQTFLNAYRAMADGTKPRKAENWLLTIAHNEVRRHFRDNQKKGYEVEFDEQLAPPAPERVGDPRVADVLRALRQIPPAQRSALVMREFEGRAYAEIAEIMGLSERALEALIFRARRSLAEQLEGALTCAEAEEAAMRRLDGRLPRREARRLRKHVKDCLRCARFGRVQRQQRSLLKGLSVMPVPASIFLFRGETAAAAGGSLSLATGGAAAGAGATGIASGLFAKAAAVTAATAVAGGVGYEVAVAPAPAVKSEPKVTQRAEVTRAAAARPVVLTRRPAVTRKAAKLESRPTKRPQRKAKAPARQASRKAGASRGRAKTKAPTMMPRVKPRAVKTQRVKLPPLKQPSKRAKQVKQPKPVPVQRRPTKPARSTAFAARERAKPVRPAEPALPKPARAVKPTYAEQGAKHAAG